MSVSVAPCELAVTYVKCCPGDEALTGALGASQLLTEQPRCLHPVSPCGEQVRAGRCCLDGSWRKDQQGDAALALLSWGHQRSHHPAAPSAFVARLARVLFFCKNTLSLIQLSVSAGILFWQESNFLPPPYISLVSCFWRLHSFVATNLMCLKRLARLGETVWNKNS